MAETPIFLPSPNKTDHCNGPSPLIERLLKKAIGIPIASFQGIEDWIENNIPYMHWEETSHLPDTVAIYLISKTLNHRNVGDLFLEIIKKWIIPYRNIQIESFINQRLTLKNSGKEFCVCEIKILIEDASDLLHVQTNLPKLEKEIFAAIKSDTYARFLLENKTIDYDPKIILAYQDLVKISNKNPNAFDSDIFHQLAHFTSITDPKFREVRQARHIARIICSQYLIRRGLYREINLFREKRHLHFRFLKTELKLPFGTKPTLGIIVGIHIFHKYEFFDEKHIIGAVQKFIPKARGVRDSSYSFKLPHDSILTLYIELEKSDGNSFQLQELKMLKTFLPHELKMRIENLIPSIFMFRNEEEVIRNILILSQELKYVKDLPQVMITFDKQTANDVHFTVILVRILKKHSKNISQELCSNEHFQFIPERRQIVGYLRKKYPKEAHIFRIKLKKHPSILRADSSVNLFEARQKIVSYLTEAVSEIRDYNGGMILKQGELLSRFKEIFQDKSFSYTEILEDFFYSISPIEMQATLPLDSIKALFSLFLEAIQKDLTKKENYFFKTLKKHDKTFAMIRSGDYQLLEEVRAVLDQKKFPLDKSLTSSTVSYQGSYSQGYILDHIDPKAEKAFIHCLEEGLRNWLHKMQNKQVLRLSFADIPESLDPRLRGDEVTAVIIKLLFDGLMRLNKNGKPSFAVAKSVSISSDHRIYEFKIRDCLWSDGSPVTAHDFAYAWKKILSPKFATPFAYFFYTIKNAKLAKEAKCSLQDVGIQVIDEKTLKVELEHPNPYFLELTAHSLYSPVNHRIDRIHPNWAMHEGETYVCNGPFMLERFNSSLELIKNPKYWDKDAVKLDQVHIYKMNDYIAAQMFKNDEIDWIGRPSRPWQPYFSIGSKEPVESYSVSGIFWYFFNVEKFPFNHPKMRKAFAYAINRREAANALYPKGHVATTLLPLNHTTLKDSFFPDGDVELARKLFHEALADLKIKLEDFPTINMMHADTYVKKIVAKIIKEQWRKAFNIPIRLECYEWNTQFAKMIEGDFQVCSVSWISWINDPMYTLEAFKYRNNSVNFPKWENKEYQKLLHEANHEIEMPKRREYIARAERILLDEMPITPIFYEEQYYMKKPGIKGYFPSETGIVDFKWVSIKREPSFFKIKKEES